MKPEQNSSPLGNCPLIAEQLGSESDGGQKVGRGLPRGIRNNNPLNIRRVKGQFWKGEVVSPIEDREFVQFAGLEYGLRAAFCILRTYRDKYKAVCIEDIITRWAPPTENDTRKYITDLCKLTGFGGKERLTENEWPRLVQAMARIECGAVLSEDVIQKGFRLFKKIQN